MYLSFDLQATKAGVVDLIIDCLSFGVAGKHAETAAVHAIDLVQKRLNINALFGMPSRYFYEEFTYYKVRLDNVIHTRVCSIIIDHL